MSVIRQWLEFKAPVVFVCVVAFVIVDCSCSSDRRNTWTEEISWLDVYMIYTRFLLHPYIFAVRNNSPKDIISAVKRATLNNVIIIYPEKFRPSGSCVVSSPRPSAIVIDVLWTLLVPGGDWWNTISSLNQITNYSPHVSRNFIYCITDSLLNLFNHNLITRVWASTCSSWECTARSP